MSLTLNETLNNFTASTDTLLGAALEPLPKAEAALVAPLDQIGDRLPEGAGGAPDWLMAAAGEAGTAIGDAVQAIGLPDFRTDGLAPDFLARLDDLGDDIAALTGRLGLPATQDLADLIANIDQLNINGLERLLNALPEELRGPDATGEVATGQSDFQQAEIKVAAGLAAMPRVVDTLGPTAVEATVTGAAFSLLDRYEDADSGFMALRLRPLDGGPEVFAIDGLQVGSIADSVAAVDLGTLQAESPAFAEMVADARDAELAEHRGVQFVGPSLGGAVAQVAAYETAQALIESGQCHQPVPVELITVDSLGGRDAAERLNGGGLDPAALSLINAVNIRTEGDLISRIGSHIGPTISFAPVDSAGNPTDPTVAARHVNVESLLKTLETPALFEAGVRGAPAEVSGFALVSNALGAQVADAYLASSERDDPAPVALQIPGTATLTENNTLYQLDADSNGVVDLAVRMSEPVPPATADLVL